jgi:hypothetical protein
MEDASPKAGISKPRRHHFVPQFYLRGFTSRQAPGQIFVYDKDTGSSLATSVKNAAVKRDYYRLNGVIEGDHSPYVLEDAFSQNESKSKHILEKLISRDSLTNDERAEWAVFMALLHLRGPAARMMAAEAIAYASKTAMDFILAKRDRFEKALDQMRATGMSAASQVSYAQALEFHRGKRYTLEISEESTLMSLTAGNQMAEAFYDMKWTVVRCAVGHQFITSDNPVMYRVPKRSHHPVLGSGGLGSRDVKPPPN